MPRVLLLSLSILAAGCCSGRWDTIPERSREDFPSIYPEKRLLFDDAMEIRYVEAGQGFPIVFIHGIGADSHQWNLNLPWYAGAFRVIAADMPGHGKSSRPDGYPYSVDRSAEAVVALLDHEKIDRAVLVGNSMGGLIALLVAIRHPERVERLVLVDAAGGAELGFLDQRLAGSALFASKVAPLGLASECLVREGTSYVFEDPESLEGNPIYEGYIRKTLLLFSDPGERDRYQAMLSATLESILDCESYKQVGAIGAPTLVLWGEDDFIIDVDYADEIAKTMHAKLAVHPECGHVPSLEVPDWFHAQVDPFLADLAHRGPTP